MKTFEIKTIFKSAIGNIASFTSYYIKATNEENALKKFKDEYGNEKIYSLTLKEDVVILVEDDNNEN
jgi:hypothetical protein